MIELNKKNNLPSNIGWYFTTNFIIPFIILFLLSKIFSSPGIMVLAFFPFFVLGVPILIALLVSISFLSFVLEDDKITINSGVLIKKSITISFSSIQSITNTSGLVARLFGLSCLRIWTASPSHVLGRDNQRRC